MYAIRSYYDSVLNQRVGELRGREEVGLVGREDVAPRISQVALVNVPLVWGLVIFG